MPLEKRIPLKEMMQKRRLVVSDTEHLLFLKYVRCAGEVLRVRPEASGISIWSSFECSKSNKYEENTDATKC